MDTQQDHLVRLRQRAEAALNQNTNLPHSRENIQEMSHELNVYQVELEIQLEDLQQAYNAIEAARQQYSDLFEFAPVGYIQTNALGITVKANLTAAHMLGIERDALENTAFAEFIMNDERDAYHVYRRAVLHSHQTQTCEIQLQRADGSTFYAQLVTDQPDANSGLLRTAITDISSVKQTELLLRRFNIELEQRVEERTAQLALLNQQQESLLQQEQAARQAAEAAEAYKDQFVAMVGHELLTPLTVIKGFISTIIAPDNGWEIDKVHEFLTIADIETDRLTGIILQLLDLSKIQAGGLILHKTVEHPSQVIQMAMPQLNLLTKDHILQIEIAPDIPSFAVDIQRISQILTNFVSNAAKYAPPHTAIRLAVTQAADQVMIRVSDQGTGIPADQREHVFTPFYRLEQHQTSKGTGLGLAICKQLVEAHGGQIWIEDHLPQGTTMAFALPMTAAADAT